MGYCPIFKDECPKDHVKCEFYEDTHTTRFINYYNHDRVSEYDMVIPGVCKLKK